MDSTRSATSHGPVLRVIRRVWGDRPTTRSDAARRLGPHLRTSLRLTLAAVIAYLAATWVNPDIVDLTASLTALLVVQASTYSTLRMGLVRVAAVLTGVLLAIGVSHFTGLQWWSLGIVVLSSLLMARLLRLTEQMMEVPISAMLILAGAAPDTAAEVRVANTLIGAGVGMAINLLMAPPVPVTTTTKAVGDLAEEIADLLDRLSEAIALQPVTRAQLSGWLARARTLYEDIAGTREQVSQMREARRLNLRAIGTPDVEPPLRTGLDALEGSLNGVRGLLATLLADAPSAVDAEDTIGEDLRGIFAAVLSDTGDCVRGFGELVEAEASGRVEDAQNALAHSLEVLHETRAVLTELMMMETADNEDLWLLRGSTLGAIQQVMQELDLDDRERAREKWLAEEESRLVLPRLVTDTLWHPEQPLPRGLHRELQTLRSRRAQRAAERARAIAEHVTGPITGGLRKVSRHHPRLPVRDALRRLPPRRPPDD